MFAKCAPYPSYLIAISFLFLGCFEFLWGNAAKAEKMLGWKREVDFKGLVAMMMDADLKEIAGMSCEEYKEGKMKK